MREEVREEFKKRGQRDVSTGARNINPEGIFERLPEDAEALCSFTGVIADMSRTITGSEINHYRRLYKDEFRKIPPALQRRVIEDAVAQLVEDDAPSAKKFLQRVKSIKESTEKEVSEILEKRRELWKRRLEKLWL